MNRTAPIRRNRHGSRFPKRRDPKFMAWMKQWAFATNCEVHGAECRYWPAKWPMRSHLIPRSRGGYDKGNVVLLCRKHHEQQEKRTDAFNREHNIDLYARAERWAKRYDEGFEFVESA